MTNTISIHGNAADRVFTYTENGIHNEFTAPGGAALIAGILGGKTRAKPVPTEKSRLREHLELACYEDKKSKKSYYAIGRGSGITPGTARIDTPAAPCALLWGSDFEMLPVKPETLVLWASNTGLPKKEPFAEIADRCLLVLDADVLRSAGAMVSRQISWERTATELIWQMHHNPAISYLMQARYILITFAEDGAVRIKHKNDSMSADLILTHGGQEGSLREKLQGRIDDAFLVMTTAAAMQLEDIMSGNKELRVLPILKSAEALMLSGYSIDRLKNNEFDIPGAETEEDETAFKIPFEQGQNAVDPGMWCISNSVGDRRIFDTAYEFVREGSKAIDGLPKLTFGFLTTVDRWEIEAFQNIRNLIVSYADSKSVRPLSIAVFGSPGSGKSFGVTQIAQNVLPGKAEKLEFNVSQFTGPGDLSAAFHRVRDVILEGKLPLVFFDEFDSDREGLALGWVKSFLMPMQDGKFKDESGEHPLGKCILVFAGGTAASFEEFILPMQSDDTDVQQGFKNIKGPDFVSRLRGTINVLGPNPKDESDKNYILRRALLLRSLCERKLDMKKGAPISPNVLWAMLLAPKYKHGARSMEAILDMSRIEGNVWEPVSLPFYSQLSLHVDADAFMKLVLREVILSSHMEQLAQAAHEGYLKELQAAGTTDHPSAVAWIDLTEDKRDANREQARHIAEHLNMIGYSYDSGDTPFPSVKKLSEEEVLLIAQNEHIRWMNERIAAGWVYGPVRDDERLIHPLLVEWEALSEEEQKKDVDVARKIIPLLKSVGLRVYKTI